ncbi:uncharacterized protein LOC128999760 [Macrosteles quadrilineatus]|uniref:uncharacterized protein LOC128999760 n=1 Tax=Macrosteles quadrilineatus TaxID=74068 RepID=UPI0023E2EDC0|nr:uncharacterized protein LOC128999760 [Macrosteles quadrilineatus]
MEFMMLVVNNILLFVILLLVFCKVHGSEIEDLAPVLPEDQDSFYFLDFESKPDDNINPVVFSTFKPDNDKDNEFTLYVLCRITDDIMSMDIMTADSKEENRVILDTIFTVQSCSKVEDITNSIYPQQPYVGKEFSILYVLTNGECRRRRYLYKTWEFTATVLRSQVENVDCPESKGTGTRKGIVKEWSPKGLFLQKSYGTSTITMRATETIKFGKAQGYSLVCRTDDVGNTDEDEERGEYTQAQSEGKQVEEQEEETEEHETGKFTATVEWDGFALDRVKMRSDTCSVDNISPEFDQVKKEHVITFKTVNKGVVKRKYAYSTKQESSYKIFTLERKSI